MDDGDAAGARDVDDAALARGGSANVYTTFPAGEDWKPFARTLLEERLAACVNAAPIESLYWWQGKLASDSETALLFKTTAAHVARLMERISELHPYDTPCVERLPVGDVEARYLAWMRASVEP